MSRDSELSSNVSTETLTKSIYLSWLCSYDFFFFVTTAEDQKEVQDALAPVKNKWMEVGIFLGLKISGLKDAMLEEDDKIAYVTKKFLKKDYMVNIYGEPTWKRVVEAIGAKAGGNNPRQAMEIAQKHQGTTLSNII